jgi:uncharacterized membrane protein (UPF0127 family)
MVARGPVLALAIAAMAACGRSSGEQPGGDDGAARETAEPGARDRGGDVSESIRDEEPDEPGPEVVFRPSGRPEARVAVEVMRTPRQIQRGLMYRAHLPPDDGMLFVFPSAAERRFWMKNTLVALDIIFVDRDLEVVGVVADAAPKTTVTRSLPGVESQYVVEVNAGWARAHGVEAGVPVELVRVAPPGPGDDE